MENIVQIFENAEFDKVRVLNMNNELWFVAKDVAEKLGYGNPRQGVASHVDDEDKRVQKLGTPSGIQNMTIINESGLYSLILSSKLPIINWLLENNFVYRDNHNKLIPYSQYEEYFCIKDSKSANSKWAGTQTLITSKGKEAFRLLLEVVKNG